ncbi:hypothetical protein Q765_15745 [Flavobacterium rivuli WB 3.3-2 = DSM 21788]|uniref:Repeat protein (TIGR03806 family) n=1 Tax=Flavobacterium rivuli WB 3.3-2 = DSM 21788 TaxID=1121895 RepID=A0A0A2M1I2_9FLAO|nr:SO2930 family diheme c-type cytochrome [Flavobacterium rivuli]KGO85481.1 hypothetical protein Q765_15745 [Flavobacterium rivuli WB 3.3-2 = DSM 21788]
MKQNLLTLILCVVFYSLFSCGDNGNDDYIQIPAGLASPVIMNLDSIPYTKLSHYNFFEGDIKNQQPVQGVLPYDLNSSLFTDYALKKRFVWMPEGTKATYVTDGEVLDFPTGTALIKTFYYDNAYPSGTTDIVETRIMIKKADGWIFANYVWNAEMTEAVLTTNSGSKTIKWYQGDYLRTVNYKIPSQAQCASCHTLNNTFVPIGPKPQNLNKNYTYTDSVNNQLYKWMAIGYLNAVPPNIASTADWTDVSLSLDVRARSYLDINCAHCHTTGGSCSYTPMNLAFNKTNIRSNLGICIEPQDFVSGDEQYIIAGQDAEASLMLSKIRTTDPNEMMPLIGRSLIHREGIALIQEWIDTMDAACP